MVKRDMLDIVGGGEVAAMTRGRRPKLSFEYQLNCLPAGERGLEASSDWCVVELRRLFVRLSVVLSS
jgi:hypothetical protein